MPWPGRRASYVSCVPFLTSFILSISQRFDQPEQCNARGLPGRNIGVAGEMKMRRAIARTPAPGMTAEGNDLAFLVTAIRIAAIALLEIDQRETARVDFDTAKLN